MSVVCYFEDGPMKDRVFSENWPYPMRFIHIKVPVKGASYYDPEADPSNLAEIETVVYELSPETERHECYSYYLKR